MNEPIAPVLHKVGNRRHEWMLRPEGRKTWQRRRLPLIGRHWLTWRGGHNPRTLERERRLADKRPLWWLVGLAGLVATAPFLSDAMLQIAIVFCVFAAINVIWTLIIGAAGILSLATMATVGLGAYAAAAANVYLGVPWPLMFPVGLLVGLMAGGLLALPSTRIDGLYYALLTIGVAEICRVSISQIRALAPQNSSINNVDSFIPQDWFLQRPGLLLGFASAFVLLLLALLLFRLVNSERLGLQLQAAREDEEFSEAVGIDYKRARLLVFLIASGALGVIGAYYAMLYRSISLNIFSLDQLLLMFAMIVIGGMGRAEGAVIGTAIVVLIDRALIDLGPLRIILIAAVVIIVTLTTHRGLADARSQFRAYRNRIKSERRAARTRKGGEVMPEEATEIADKQLIAYRRFDKRLRDRLKALITPELIEEHRRAPLGPHSDALARVMNYFRRGEMSDKYAILQEGDPGSWTYSVMALSGEPGKPPRVVDDRHYGSRDEAYHAVFLLRVNDLLES
ncbi:MAG: branched-chain amino acid ABC transporter permease [Pararhodobacter sp.]|nr:branched-chain amino acid ABC transporter permease [Pararhodobacter sp.]